MNPQQESNLPPGLSRPAQRALTNAGYRRLEQLTRVSQAEVEGLYGVGGPRRSRYSGVPWLRTVYRSPMGRKPTS
jgi:hypothetical protein